MRIGVIEIGAVIFLEKRGARLYYSHPPIVQRLEHLSKMRPENIE